MKTLLLTPPIAFLVILAVSWLLSFGSSRLAFRRRGPEGALRKAYTGGEDMPASRAQPDYSQFFPFAFFFTILHVVTLIVATVPTRSVGAFVIAVIYLFGALLGLSVLFRR